MKVTRRLKITVTQHRVLRSAPVRAVCPVCAREVETLPAQAAKVMEIDGQALTGLLDAGPMHVIALANGGWRICRDSLFG